MKLVFVGPPGAGKGTQAKQFAVLKNIPHISTGDMLRQAVSAGTALGKQVKEIMEQGKLVPDDLMVSVIAERIGAPDCLSGYILDGFPRTVHQAHALDEMLNARGDSLDGVVYFEISGEELLKRLEHRREAEGRADDSDETQKQRLKVYQEQTAPLISHYRGLGLLRQIDAQGTVEEIQARLSQLLA